MKLVANRQLCGEYGVVGPGQEFETRDDIAEQLLKEDVVHRANPLRVDYETKVIVPEASEVGARQPFRNVPLPDEESEGLAPEGNRMFSAADLPPLRADDPSRRGGRPRPGAKQRPADPPHPPR